MRAGKVQCSASGSKGYPSSYGPLGRTGSFGFNLLQGALGHVVPGQRAASQEHCYTVGGKGWPLAMSAAVHTASNERERTGDPGQK